MSNIYPPLPVIPPLEHEKPIGSLLNFVFSNQAWHARHDDLWPPKAGEAPPPLEFRKAIDLYLGNFCRPIRSIANEVRCVACDETLTTAYAKEEKMGMGATPLKINKQLQFWEATCGNCGYPLRCKHVIAPLAPRPPVPVLVKLDFFPMCYHPMALERKGAVN